MVHLQIDPHSGVPAYRQMMDQVKYAVAAGLLVGGDQLPSIREMARHLAVNPTTVVKAYGELAADGVIVLEHGRGAFVAEGARGMSAAERRAALERLARQIAVEAHQMGAGDDEVIEAVRRQLEELKHD